MPERNDKMNLIENQVPLHKSRSIMNQQQLEMEKPKMTPTLTATPPPTPPGTPVTTVVISSASSVHVAQQPRPTPAVDKRTGRYLALGVTLLMIFITLYHTFLRQVPLLAGLIPPAIIMVLYLLWIVYFTKKRKRQQVQIDLV